MTLGIIAYGIKVVENSLYAEKINQIINFEPLVPRGFKPECACVAETAMFAQCLRGR